MTNRGQPILLIEDDADDAQLTVRALKRANIANEVIVAVDGADALEKLLGAGEASLSARGLRPSVVLLDLKLPKVDGLEVLRRVRSDPRTRLLPVVIFTSSKEERDVIAGYELGANSYVQKPVDFGQFLDAMSRLGLYWILVNEPLPMGPGP